MTGVRFVRFYPSDWRSGCIGMTFEEEGLYIRICAHFWETGRRVPLDDKAAASRLSVDVRQYRRVKGQLIEKGKLCVAEDGLYNARAEHEFSLATGTRQAAETAAETPVGSTRGHDDREQDHGRDQTEERSAAGPELLEKYPTSSPEVSEKSAGSLEDLCEKDEQNQCPFIEPIANSHNHREVTPLPPKGASPLECLRAFESYNEVALRCGLPQAAKLTKDRERKIRARLNEYGAEGWERALANIERSAFLTGQTEAHFRANLDFVLQPTSFGKLHDGAYGNGRHSDAPQKKTLWQVLQAQEQESVNVQ